MRDWLRATSWTFHSAGLGVILLAMTACGGKSTSEPECDRAHEIETLESAAILFEGAVDSISEQMAHAMAALAGVEVDDPLTDEQLESLCEAAETEVGRMTQRALSVDVGSEEPCATDDLSVTDCKMMCDGTGASGKRCSEACDYLGSLGVRCSKPTLRVEGDFDAETRVMLEVRLAEVLDAWNRCQYVMDAFELFDAVDRATKGDASVACTPLMDALDERRDPLLRARARLIVLKDCGTSGPHVAQSSETLP